MSSTASPDLEQLHSQAARAFASRFGVPPRWAAAAPGRVNLIGEHTDYNDGHVLPIAIERWCVVVAGHADGDHSTFTTTAEDQPEEIDLRTRAERGEPGWGNYVRGAARLFQDRGCAIPNFNAVITASVPVGSGLSSSAALCVSLATVFEQITREVLEPRDKARLCQRIEHEFAGVPCGIMDQTASIMARAGQALHLDCRDGSIEHVPMPPGARAILLVIDTGVRHDLATNEYGLRRRQCEQAVASIASLMNRPISSLRDVDQSMLDACAPQLDPLLLTRACHIVSENDRVLNAVAALRAGELATFGELMYDSHDSLRDDYEVSCAELDCIVDAARTIGRAGGVFGARMTGGGFGGCAIALCNPCCVDTITDSISSRFAKSFGTRPTIFTTSAAAGAGPLPG